MVFIDGANLYMCVKEGLKIAKQVDIEKLSLKLVSGRPLERIYYYTTPSPGPDVAAIAASQKFLDRLGWINNLQVRLGRIVGRDYQLACPKCKERVVYRTHIQKGVDTRIAVDMVTMAVDNAYDTAILVSGDSDLAGAVNYIREHTHKKVENACVPGEGWAKTLREAADIRIPLTADYVSQCLLP
jgi:uncharacterized LabA/DUF88 family protein